MKNIVEKLKVAVTVVAFGLGITFGFSAPVTVSAAAKDEVCKGVNFGGGTCNDDGGQLTNVIRVIIQIISLAAGIAAVIMIIIGGFKYITSGGDSSKVSSAKNAIIYAIIGLVIVALSQFIVQFVLGRATA